MMRTHMILKLTKKVGMNFYSATVGKLKLVDSMNMIKGSLANLADQHILNNGDLTIVKESLKNFHMKHKNYYVQQGNNFFPYEYLDSFDKLEETSLPHPVIFHNLSYDLSLILKQYDENTYDFKVNKKVGMNFYSATVGKLKLVDSMNMIKGSLANIADQHILNNGDLTIVKE